MSTSDDIDWNPMYVCTMDRDNYVQDLRNDILMFIHISVLFASQHKRTCAVGRAAVSTRAFGGIVLFSLTCAWGPGSTLFRCQHCFMLFNGTYTFEPVLNL